MTQDEIIAMAREVWSAGGMYIGPSIESLAQFAALVAAKEREECAKFCDETYYKFIGPEFGEVRHGIAACAEAIRSRGTK